MDKWTTEELSDDARDAFYKASVALQAEKEDASRKAGRLGFIVGGCGTVVALLMAASATAVYLKTPVPPPPGYILIDRSDGHLDRPVPAVDAPKLFPVAVRERAIRQFITACEQYVPQTWRSIEYHNCMIMATPDEQKRREADIGILGAPHYPPTIFGPMGWAMPTEFPAIVSRGSVGQSPHETFSYQVRYRRTEVINGHEAHPLYTAIVQFQFHPELAMAEADRQVNETGFQAIAFSTVKDAP